MIQICMRGLCVSCILLGLWLGFGRKSFDPATSSAVAEAVATPATPKYKTVAIRDIQPAGYKVLADNPQTPGQATGDFGEFDPKTWRVHRFLMSKPIGGWLKIGLARPVAWIESVERNDSGQVWLEFEELGIADWATLQATEPCPSDILGEGRLVTGTFEHSSGEVLNLFIACKANPIGSTANHPFWSEDRQDFVQAGSLNPGEHLRLADGRTTTLERTEPIAEQLPVYNLEVDGEHVYFVGESGVLVHNNGEVYVRELRGRQLKPEYNGSEIRRLKKDMKKNGFNPEHPIEIAEIDGRKIIIDGHHRARAAGAAGIKKVPVVVKEVTPEQAIRYLREAAQAADFFGLPW